ncbi:hypothetical protein COB87_003120 [Candidatus Wolfebacteria bacterium]|nr:hypothetical protein [Candidatus Wolfebacteria bacterium]
MDAQEVDELNDMYPIGTRIVNGGTIEVFSIKNNDNFVIINAKDAITVGDGSTRKVKKGRAKPANKIAVNVFRLLELYGIPTAFVKQDSKTSFIAKHCKIFPYKISVRRKANGSLLKRKPKISAGQRFKEPLIDFYLKTKNNKWRMHNFPCNDPFIRFSVDQLGKICEINLHHPAKPFYAGSPFKRLFPSEVFALGEQKILFDEMTNTARNVFYALETAWKRQGMTLVDLKIEFGLTQQGKLVVAGIVDIDSLSLLDSLGKHFDKQTSENAGSVKDVQKCYIAVAKMTEKFIP